jgi:hypothetical protein
MKSPLHIPHLEDDPNDAALIQSTLAVGDITCATTCVQDCDGFVAALEDGDMTHIGTGAKALCAFRDNAHGTNRNSQIWCEPRTIILKPVLQKPDNCFLICDTIEDRGSSRPTNAPCNGSKIEQEGLNI